MNRQFPPIDPAEIGMAMRDGRAYRHNHYRIGESPRTSRLVTIIDVAALGTVAAFIGAMLAIGHAF